MNFRKVIAKNKRITFMVILTYILIMAFVGIMADVAINAIPGIGIGQNIIAFITFDKIPYATICVLLLTLLGITVIHFFGHKMMLSGTEYEEITELETDLKRKMLWNILQEMSISAGLRYTPKLYYINTPELNAFAAGWSESNALVGVTSGLAHTLNRSELQAVIAHEVGHIIHGDSRLTMYVGILANIILTVTNIFAHLFYFSGRSSSKEATGAKLILMLLNFILPLITQVLYLFLSRTREYMADAAAVKLTGDNQSMIDALYKISSQEPPKQDNINTGEQYRKAAYIFNSRDSIFSTHPSIENRIKALKGEK